MYQIENLFATTDLANVRIEGSIGDLLDRFIDQRITSDYARNEIYREAEDAFKNCKDDETIVGYWQGEFWGKWMISAARVCRYTGDAELKQFIHKSVHKMLTYQRQDGYIGTYKDSLNVYACDRSEAEKVVGWPSNWNWNVWCRKYTLWGLVECYQLTGDQAILQAAERHASQLIDELHDNQIRICDTGVFCGLPSSSIIKPMVLLSEITGDQKYLDFAVETASYWDLDDNRCPNLIRNAATGKPVHEWYPQSQTWAKAYEMMSCLDGLLELYRATGEVTYFTAVQNIYDLLLQHESNAVCSVGYNDMFAHAARQINAVSEPCDTIHWMRLSYELFMLTGDSRYMDHFELAFYNAFLAGVYRDGKWGSRGVRSAGRHITALLQAGMTKNHCCVNNMPRGFMNMAQAIALSGKDGFYLNFFSEAAITLRAADGKPVHIEIAGGFLQTCVATVTVDNTSDMPVSLHIRIPAWSRTTIIQTAECTYTPSCGSFFPLTIRPGKTSLLLKFDQTPILHVYPDDPAAYQPDEWFIRRWTLSQSESQSYVPRDYMVTGPVGTLRFGPTLLARSKRIGSTSEELFGKEAVCVKDCTCSISPKPLEDVRCGFQVEFISGKHRFSTMMCDYASAGNELLYDEDCFNLFLPIQSVSSDRSMDI